MAPEGEMRSYAVPKKSWPELYNHVKYWRGKLRDAFGKSSCGSFHFRSGKDESGGVRTRLYALGPLSPDKDHTMMYVDIPPDSGTTSGSALHWKALLEDAEVGNDRHVMSKEEELLRERMRCTISGITSFDALSRTGTLLFAAGLNLYLCKDEKWCEELFPELLELPGDTGAPLDPKMCPGDPSLIAYISKNDIHLQYGATNVRATWAGTKEHTSAGTPSFIIQEEFDRYSAIWWNTSLIGSERQLLLYEETEESQVVELSISVPAARSTSVDHMKYPLAGTPNAQSSLKLLHIHLTPGPLRTEIEVKECSMNEHLKTFFPWMEYLCRAGWTPDGKGVWAQLMNRKQTRIALVHIPVEVFVEMSGSMQDLSKSVETRISILFEEINTVWINYQDCLSFLPSESTGDKELTFIWWSEKTGYGHLYLIRSELAQKSSEGAVQGSEPHGPVILQESPLTSGDWPVVRKIPPVIDEKRGLVYFMALKDSPLETHLAQEEISDGRAMATVGFVLRSHSLAIRNFLRGSYERSELSRYVTSYRKPGVVKRLTPPNLCHFANRWERSLSVDLEGGYFVDWMSSVSVEPESLEELPSASLVWTLRLAPPSVSDLVMETDQNGVDKTEPSHPVVEWAKSEELEDLDVTPEIISYRSSNSGFHHYAILYRPVGWEKGVKYPVLLYVYGGPEVQLVRNVWSSWNGFQKYVSLGYAVIMIDGRGSAMRGLKFEGTIQRAMGRIEIEDQVEGLEVIAQKTEGLIDMTRVAIFGWSYGGYLALQALIQRPDIFKVGIAGGPVTTWYLYDTGYTERYMGVPQEDGEAYKRGSVLARVSDFPDETPSFPFLGVSKLTTWRPGRLIILHGVIDENVHFQHTSKLIEALIRAGKPYQLQIFPKERHGVRGNEANEHMDVTILNHLQAHL